MLTARDLEGAVAQLPILADCAFESEGDGSAFLTGEQFGDLVSSE